jgi:cytosine/adenosine deaminase-related metal-dependent hydrolase
MASSLAALGRDPLLLEGGNLLTLDSKATVRVADILLADGRISALGTNLAPPVGCRVLDVSDCFVLPGLIQGHVHLGQTIFRGLAERRRLLPWLRERIWPLEAGHDDESAYWCGLLGAAECLLSGTTTVQDIGLGPGIAGLLQALDDSGLRALAGKCLMDSGDALPAALREETAATLAHTAELGAAFDGADGGRLRYSINPRFILSASDALWHGIRELSAARSWPIHTHALEQEEETAAVRRLKNGRDEVEYFDEAGILAQRLSIAHGVQLCPNHLGRVDGARFSVVHCPSSNLKLGSGIADLIAIRGAGIAVGIGADGAPCGNDLDCLTQIRLAALLQHHKHGPASFSGLDAVRLATSEGARALGLGDQTGALVVGRAADVLVLSRERPESWSRRADPHDLVAYSSSRAEVRHVIADGRLLVEDGRLTHLDLGEIRRRADAALDAVLRRSGIDLD